MRILWLSNGPWCPSGYGEQTAIFTEQLAALGHDVAVLCNYGLQGRETMFDGITCYPSDGVWGNVNLDTFVKRHEADLVIALCDAWVLHPDKWPEGGPPVAVWAPVDHYPIPPMVMTVLKHPRIRPIAMSRFGEQMMRDCELDPLYIPHGVDTQLFRPAGLEARNKVRDALDIPHDVFLAGMVAANQSSPTSRKAFPQALLGFSRFARRHPDAWLYCHTNARANGGLKLDIVAEAAGCPQQQVRFPHDDAWHIGMPKATVAAVYQALDVLLMPSMGEGFGIPLVEAQASGVPVIASDHSSMTELTHAGWLVGGDPWWDEAAASFLINPSIGEIDAALEKAYEARGDEILRHNAAAFARQYDVNTVTEQYWVPALEQLEIATSLDWSKTTGLLSNGQGPLTGPGVPVATAVGNRAPASATEEVL